MLLNRTGVAIHSGPLRLSEIEEGWSVYLDRYSNSVYLQHGTARVLVPFHELDLRALWDEFRLTYAYGGQEEFLDLLAERTYEPDWIEDEVKFCLECRTPRLEPDMYYSNGPEGFVCSGCLDRYPSCADCCDRYRDSNLTSTLHDDEVCTYCRNNNYAFCSTCSGWWHTGGDQDHDHDEDGCGSGCSSPALVFSVRNDGGPLLNAGVQTTITLAKGVISPEGLGEVSSAIRDWADNQTHISDRLTGSDWHKHHKLSYDVFEHVGEQWQTKRGNFTKRLTRHAYTTYGLKLAPGLVSTVGNIGSDHSRGVDVTLEVSRDLNQSAGYWYHVGSCWFGSGEYAVSRCALKTNGGYGLRTFDDCGAVSGRAWVMPLAKGSDFYGNDALMPTFDTLTADAFVVFNGYGDLSGYAAARIVAHMTGLTYSKIEFTCDPMYINGDSGYLVGSVDMLDQYPSLSLEVDDHATLFKDEQAARATVTYGPEPAPVGWPVEAPAELIREMADVPF